MFVASNLVSQLAVFMLYVPQTVHFNLYLVELTRSVEVTIFRSVCFDKLLSEHLDFLFGPICPFLFHSFSVTGSQFLSLCHVDNLGIVLPFLRCLKLKSTSLLFKVPLDAVALVS